VLATGLVLGYLATGGVTLALGDRVAGGAWLALHLVLLGGLTNAIVVWSEHFAAALLRVPRAGERAATARALALNLGVLAVLVGVHAGRPLLAAGGAWLVGAVVAAHAAALAAGIRRALGARLAATVWFYVAASAALLAGMGLGVLLAGGAAGSADAWRAMRLAHVHLNLLGWVGLAVVGTQFTLWPTVLRTRMVADPLPAVRRSLALLAGGLAVATVGLLAQWRPPALAGLAGSWPGCWSRCSRSRAPCCAAGRTRRRRGCSPPASPGSRWRSPPTWSPWQAAGAWSTSTAGSAGWSRRSWWGSGSRC
jgi:nitrite reductase (NO-forming)